MRLLYAPEGLDNHIMEHMGHQLIADVSNGHGFHKHQNVKILDWDGGENVKLEFQFTTVWWPASELWAYGTPQCCNCR